MTCARSHGADPPPDAHRPPAAHRGVQPGGQLARDVLPVDRPPLPGLALHRRSWAYQRAELGAPLHRGVQRREHPGQRGHGIPGPAARRNLSPGRRDLLRRSAHRGNGRVGHRAQIAHQPGRGDHPMPGQVADPPGAGRRRASPGRIGPGSFAGRGAPRRRRHRLSSRAQAPSSCRQLRREAGRLGRGTRRRLPPRPRHHAA